MTPIIILKVLGSILTAGILITLARYMAALRRYRRSPSHCKLVTVAMAMIYLAIMLAMWTCG